jgi:serine/threonine protein kinase
MGLESINQVQFKAFEQMLRKRQKELDQELKLPAHKRRLEREIEFDKRLIVQSINAISRYGNQDEIRIGLISNNLFGRETLDLFIQFQDDVEKQQRTQPEVGAATSADSTTQTGTVGKALQEAPPAPKPSPDKKEPVQAQPLDQPAFSVEDRDAEKKGTPAISVAAPDQAAGVEKPVEAASSAPETAAARLKEALSDLSTGPVVDIPTAPSEPSTQDQAAPTHQPQPVISQAPFEMPVPEQEIPEEEPLAALEEPGVSWNGSPRAGNIFKGQKSSYQLEKCLGTGKYGEVWKAAVVESSQGGGQGTFVALKIANPGLTPEEKQQFEAEISVLDQLRNVTPEDLIRADGKMLVPEVFEVVLDPAAPPQRSFFTQSLATGIPIDELRRKNNRLPEPKALEITAQLCRVLQAVHEGLQRSLLGFQPENIFWDELEQRIFFIDWKHLSKPEQANFSGDIISAASELYKMVMGVPAPIPGSHRSLIEPLEQWNELSQGTQDILMHAFNPFRPYQTANELREDLEWLGEWWNRAGNKSLDRFKELFNTLPQNEQALKKKHEEQLKKTFWAAGVLGKIAARPENEAQSWAHEFRNLVNQLGLLQTGAYWLEKGKRSFQAGSWDLADQDFGQALKDAGHVLEAARWLQAVKAARSTASDPKAVRALDIGLVDEAMNFLQGGSFAEAAPIFEQLAGEPGQKGFDALAAEARLQESLQSVPGLLEKRHYKELAEVYKNAIGWIEKLPQDFQAVLKPKFGNLELKHRQYAARYEKFQKLQERFDQLKAAQQREFSEYYRKLKELFDLQPGNVELLKQGKESIYEFLSQGKYAEGRALAALCLDYGAGADPYLHQVWQYACQLERSWQAWSRGNGPAFRNALLNQAWPSELWANLVEKILEKCMELPGDIFAAEFLDEIISASKIRHANPKIREQIKIEKAKFVRKIDEAFRIDEDNGTELLLNLMQEHPYSLTLFNLAAAKVDVMLQKNNFSAAYRIAESAVSQFSILDLQGDSKSVAQVLILLHSFLSSTERIIPLQTSWSNDGAVGLAEQLELEDPWREGALWGEDELVFLRDFLTACLDKLEDDFLGWSLVFTKIDPNDELYLRLEDKREELYREFRDGANKPLQADPVSGLENLRVLWVKYPLDPMLEDVSLDVVSHEFLFKDEHAQKARKAFNRLSGFPQTLKERIELCVKYAQYYRVHPDSAETAYKELQDKLSESGKLDHLSQEKMAFLSAVRISWFKQALAIEDLAALQRSLMLLPKDKWTRAEAEALSSLRKTFTQKVQMLTDSTSEALKKGEQLEKHPAGLTAKLVKNIQKQPGLDDVLLEWNGLMDDLRTWIEKTRQAEWNEESFRLESYLEKLEKLYARTELLTTRKVNETNLVLISELWKLALPGTPEDPQGDPTETPKASEENRRQWLLQMDKACQELIKTFPKDGQKPIWVGWQSRIQAELRKIQKP